MLSELEMLELDSTMENANKAQRRDVLPWVYNVRPETLPDHSPQEACRIDHFLSPQGTN
jgi:hypothetical protein